MASEPSQIDQMTTVAKALGAAAKDVVIGLGVIVLVIWLVRGSAPLDWANIRFGPDGLEIKAVVKEAKSNAADVAKELEKVRGDMITLQDLVGQIDKALGSYQSNRTEPNLNKLVETVAAALKFTNKTAAQVEEASTETAKALTRIDEAALQLDRKVSDRPVATSPPITGWYYLGKISKDGKKWLPSSALGTLKFEPEIVGNENIVNQIRVGQTIVRSTGYKYLRSNDSSAGKRVDASIARTLGPNVPVLIREIDSSGSDSADGQTVLWARVEVLPPS